MNKGLLTFICFLFFANFIIGQNPSGDLRIEMLKYYNLVVDHNIQTPAGASPKSVYIGVQICNDGNNDMEGVFAYIGDYNNGTPGAYPTETPSGMPYSGTFSFTHEGGDKDATRYIGNLAAGECITQYWLLSYPLVDANNNPVFGANSNQNDDLHLSYDVWASAIDDGSFVEANDSKTVQLRAELSASANKIWPNTTSKVPNQFLNAFPDKELGWRLTTNTTHPGASVVLEGIWFDLGNVNKGFDNDGDYKKDYNFLLQPVGNPEVFDPECFRLVKVSGLIVVKPKQGANYSFEFVDQMHFEDMPKNTGIVGMVFYEFAVLNGPCSAELSPYQEAASGKNREKFNSDFGTPGGTLTSPAPSADFIVTAPPIADPGDLMTISVSTENTSTLPLGMPEYAAPVVFEQEIPTDLFYVSGSAENGHTLPAGTGVDVLYSTDDGTTWLRTEPSPSTSITRLRWVLDKPLQPGESASITYQLVIPIDYPESSIVTETGISAGGGEPFKTDDFTTIIGGGTTTISGVVFGDNGAGGANNGDALQSGGEAGLPNIKVSLFNDMNSNGEFDNADAYVAQTQSASDGSFSFSDLAGGDYIAIVDLTDEDIPAGWINTTPDEISFNTVSPPSSFAFGFTSIIELKNTLVSDPIVAEDDYVNYQVEIENLAYTEDTDNSSTVIAWASQLDPATDFNYYPNNLLGPPDVQLAWPNTWSRTAKVKGFDFSGQNGEIEKVEIIVSICLDYSVWNDYLEITFQKEDGTTAYVPNPVLSKNSTPSLNDYVGPPNIGWLILDVTDIQTWDWSIFDANWSITMDGTVVGGNDGSKQYTDAIGVRITSSCCASPEGEPSTCERVMDPLPMEYEYDNTKLQFVSSVPPASSVSNGVVYFDDLGPIYPNEVSQIDFTFRALNPPNNDPTQTVAEVSQGENCDGMLIIDIDTAGGVSFVNKGSISGYVFGDVDGDGWVSALGYEQGTDNFLSGVEVSLYGCHKNGDLMYPAPKDWKSCTHWQNGGEWQLVKRDTTNTNGYYSMTGIDDGYYYMELDESTLTNAADQTADPDITSGLAGSYADAKWKHPNDRCRDLGIIGIGNDHTQVNFGYHTYASISGIVWEDINGNGVKDNNESTIGNAPVEFTHSGCTPGVNCPVRYTNGTGTYNFSNAVAGTNYTVVLDLANVQGADSWEITYEYDGTTDNACAVSVATGQQLFNVDFGVQAIGPMDMGGKVYYDWTGNAHINAGDEGIANVTMRLYEDLNGNGVVNNSDQLIQTIETDINGDYLFENKPEANYIITLGENTLPIFPAQTEDPDEYGPCTVCDAKTAIENNTDYTVTSADLWNKYNSNWTSCLTCDEGWTGTNDNEWPNNNLDEITFNDPINNPSACVTHLKVRFRLASSDLEKSTQSYYVDQVNYNYPIELNGVQIGTFDPVEMPYVCNFCEDIEILFPVDLGSIGYNFGGSNTLDVNFYEFNQGLPYNQRQDVCVADIHLEFISNSCTADHLSLDFGYQPSGGTSQIDGYAFVDDNANGIYNSGEEMLDEVEVRLESDLDGDGVYNWTETTVTDANGNFLFDGLMNSNYRVVVVESDPDIPQDYFGASFTPTTPILYDVNLAGGCEAQSDCDGITQDAVYSDSKKEKKSLTYTHTTGSSANLLIVSATVNNDKSVTTAQYNGIDLTLAKNGSFDGRSLYVYYLVDPPSGSYDVYISTGGGDKCDITVGSVSYGCVDTENLFPGGLFEQHGQLPGVQTIGDDVNCISGNYLLDFLVTDDDNVTHGTGQVQVVNEDNPSDQEFLSTSIIQPDFNNSDIGWTLINSEFVYIYGCLQPCVSSELEFGFANPGAAVGYIFSDNNGDGTVSEKEQGMGGVQLFICNASDGYCNATNAVDTVSSSIGGVTPLGFFQFSGLAAGTYTIAVDQTTLPSGYVLTADPNTSGIPCYTPLDLDDPNYTLLNANCDHADVGFNVSLGGQYAGAYFGYQPPGVLGGTVWFDDNEDGILGDSEDGLEEVSVEISNVTAVTVESVNYNPGEFTLLEVTDEYGNYVFTNLPDGTFDVDVDVLTDYVVTYDADGGLDGITRVVMNAGKITNADNGWCSDTDCSQEVDFGMSPNFVNTLAGIACLDDDEDGRCDTGGETFPEGTIVNIVDLDGEEYGETTVAADGTFFFDNLPTADLVVSVSKTVAPLRLTSLTTSIGDTPAYDIQDSDNNAIQFVSVSGNVIDMHYGFTFSDTFDLGDLPLPYLTKADGASSGPAHIIPAGGSNLHLGTLIDAEPRPVLNNRARGDDNNGIDDEDGITFSDASTWTEGAQGGNLTAEVTGNGYLLGYGDFNDDGDFDDAGEMFINDNVSTGLINYDFDIPAGTDLSGGQDYYFRFRLFKSAPFSPLTSYNGITEEGEVEDYRISVCKNITIAGEITGVETGCDSYDPIEIIETVPADGGGGDIEYIWEESSDGGLTWTIITGETGRNYNPPVVSATKRFRRGARRSKCVDYQYSNALVKTVVTNYTDGGLIVGDEDNCGIYDPEIILNVVAPSGGIGTSTPFYQWEQSTDNINWNPILNANEEYFDPGVISQTTHYRRTARKTPCGEYLISNTITKMVSVNYVSAGQVAGGESVCGTFDPTEITSLSLPTGGVDGYEVLQWELSTNDGASWSEIPGATSETYNPGIITETTWYRRKARRVPCTVWINSNVVKKIVKPFPTASIVTFPISASGYLCELTDYEFNAADAGPNVDYTWDFGTYGNPNTALGQGPHHIEFDVPDADALTSTIVTLTTEKDGCVSTDNKSVTFRPEIQITDVVTFDPSACQSNNGAIVIQATYPSGTNVEYSIDGGLSWQTNNAFSNEGAGVYQVNVRYQGGDCSESYGAVALSDPPPEADILLSASEECTGQTVVIEAIPITGNPVFTWTFGNGAIPSTISGKGPHSVYFTQGGYASIAVTMDENNCIGVRDTILPIVDNYNDGGTILGGETLCSTYDPSEIVGGSNPSGGVGGTLVYQWEYREDDGAGGYTAWQDVSGANGVSHDPGIISATTEFRRKARRAPCADWVHSNSVIARLVEKPQLGDDTYYTVCPGFPHADNVSDNDLNLVNPTYTLIVFPTNGTVDFEVDGEFIYDPSSTYCGTDEFQYMVCNDGTGCCDTATVLIDLTDTNPPSILNVPANILISCDDQIPVADAVDVIEDCQTVSIGTDEFTTQGTDSCALNNYLITRIWNGVDYCSNTAAAQQTITIQDATAPDIFRIYTLPNGKKMVAGVMENVSNYWKTISLPVQFASPPVILTQITTRNDFTPVAAKMRNVSTTQFQLKLVEEEGNDGVHGMENVAWVAFEPGAYNGTNPFEVGSWLINSNNTTETFTGSYTQAPDFFATVQTNNETDPALVRISNPSPTGLDVFLQEETSSDAEQSHILEKVGYFAMELEGNITNDQGEVIGEMGRVDLTSSSISVDLENKYHNPIVIIGAITTNENEPVAARVNTVNSTSFNVLLQEWDYLDGVHGIENVCYLVVEGSLPLNKTIACDEIPPPLNIGTEIIAIDNCDATIKLIMTEDNNGFDCQTDTTYTRTWYTIDDCGNETLLQENHILEDVVPPSFNAPENLTIVCSEDKDDLSITGEVVDEADNCSEFVSMTYTDNETNLVGCNGHIIRTWKGVDDCGNITEKLQIIYVSPERDTDKDGVVDYFDHDDDNDGIPDVIETHEDSDGDGIPNDQDLDSDNDGIPDIIEAVRVDADGDGRIDFVGEDNWDSDGDGFAYGFDGNDIDTSEAASVVWDINDPHHDTDGDLIPNFLDRDSDNDAIPDLIEVGGVDTNGDGILEYPIPGDPTSMEDADMDGFYDRYDPDVDEIPGVENPDAPLLVYDGNNFTGTHVSIVPDSDGDQVPDFLDSDSDNDGTGDLIEIGGIDLNGDGRLEINANFVDLNNDGFSDIYVAFPLILTDEEGSVADGQPEDTNENGTVYELGDVDYDGSPNHLDHDSDNDNILDILETGLSEYDGDNNGVWDNWSDDNFNGYDDVAEATGNIMTEDDGLIIDGKAEDSGDDDETAFLSAQPDGSFAQTNNTPDIDDDGDNILNFLDEDSDNDLLPDYIEDVNFNNTQDEGETDLYNPDSDFDQIRDGIEDHNRNGQYNPGETDPLNPNSDGDSFTDGEEDLNHDGIVDLTESDPTNACDPIIHEACRGIVLDLKVNLMGAMIDQDSLDTMRDDLRYFGKLPEFEPYSGLPHLVHVGQDQFPEVDIWTYGGIAGDSTANTGNNPLDDPTNTNFGIYKEWSNPYNFYVTGRDAPVDWVMVELRAAENKDSIVATRAGLLQRDGDVRDTDGINYLTFDRVPSGNYYISVRHRNHLGVMTADPLLLSPAVTTVDFTDPATEVYGDHSRIVLENGKMALWAGDLNGDGYIIYQGPWNDILNLFQSIVLDEGNTDVLANYIVTGYDMADFNMDGNIIFQGPGNDKAKLLINTTLASPDNTLGLANFVLIEKLP